MIFFDVCENDTKSTSKYKCDFVVSLLVHILDTGAYLYLNCMHW